MAFKEEITKKIGPLPTYGWFVIFVAAGIGIILYRKNKGTSNTANTIPTLTPAPSGNLTYPSGSGGSTSSSTTTSDNSALDTAINALTNAVTSLGTLIQNLGTNNGNNNSGNPSNPGVNPGGTNIPTTPNPPTTPTNANPGNSNNVTPSGGNSNIPGMVTVYNNQGMPYQVPASTAAWFAAHPAPTSAIPTTGSRVENAVPYQPQGTETNSINGGPVWVDIAAPAA